jgi:hypothetical protein
MGLSSELLSHEEFASLLIVGKTSAAVDRPAVISPDHCAKLIALGYMVDLEGRLRMTTPGRQRIRAGFEDRPVPDGREAVLPAASIEILGTEAAS